MYMFYIPSPPLCWALGPSVLRAEGSAALMLGPEKKCSPNLIHLYLKHGMKK